MAKPYVVRRNENYCTWEEDISELPKNTVVLAGEGCRIIHYVNGAAEKTYTPDNNTRKTWLVVNTGRMVKKGDELVVGVNDEKEFTIAWGVGGVPYTDRRLKLETRIGMNGEFKFSIYHHPTLIGAIGKTNIVPKDVKDFTAAKLEEMLKTKLSEMLKGLKYDEVMSQQSNISKEIQYDYEEELKKIGIKLTSFSLKEIFFPEDYVEKREEASGRNSAIRDAYEEEDRQRRERAREQEEASRILTMLKDTSNVTASAGNTPVYDNRSGNISDRVRYCPKCGKALKADDRFCSYCGKSL